MGRRSRLSSGVLSVEEAALLYYARPFVNEPLDASRQLSERTTAHDKP